MILAPDTNAHIYDLCPHPCGELILYQNVNEFNIVTLLSKFANKLAFNQANVKSLWS